METWWAQLVGQIVVMVLFIVVAIKTIIPRLAEKLIVEHVQQRHREELRKSEAASGLYRDILKSSIEAGAASGQEIQKRSIEAVQALWVEILWVEKEFGPLIGIESITTKEEFNMSVQGNGPPHVQELLEDFSDFADVVKKLQKPDSASPHNNRILVSEKLWNLYVALVGIYGRFGILVSKGIRDGMEVDWQNDALFVGLVRDTVPAEKWEVVQKMKFSGFKTLVEVLHLEFIAEARQTMRGTQQFGAALGEFHQIVDQQERKAITERAESRSL